VVTVRNAQACKMGYWDAAAKTYVEIPCTAGADGSYRFRAPDMAHEILLVVMGDINLDGKLDILDKNSLADAITKDTQTLTAIAKFAVDVNGNGKINSADLILIARSILPESHAAYKPFVWKVDIPA
jgi:hypothetical protein